jgi:hypothetical protein
MQTGSPECDCGSVPGATGIVRMALLSTLFAVAGIYVWYCTPLGVTLINATVVALLAVAAAACVAASARLALRQRRVRPPRHDGAPAGGGLAT